VRILGPTIQRLIAHSLPCSIADIERESGDRGARRELAAIGLSSISINELQDRIGFYDVLVVANDFHPDVVVSTMELCRQRKTLRVGVIEGSNFSDPDRYRRVDHVLGWGLSCREAVDAPVHIVGSPIIEAAWRRPSAFALPPFVLINFKHDGEADERRAWIEQAIAACKTVGIPFRISSHPRTPVPPGFPIAQDLNGLMPGASAVLSPPSTVVFEAMAAGKPVVLFPPANGSLQEFADTKGAFEIARDPAELPAMLRSALEGKDSYRDRCRAFFDFHVSIDPEVSASERMVQALIRLA
jgi:hypothetical protein